MPIVTDTITIPGTTIVYDDTNGGVAIDYSSYYERIASALETITTDTTSIADSSSGSANSLAEIAADLDNLKTLANSSGIRTITPYGYIGNTILYLLYIKQAQILDETFAGDNQQAESLAKFNQILEEMFSNFDATKGGF